MDNTKTGTLIKELRKEKGMTQKELAQILHITDRAVSKWERGLNAPDIALLEPLAKALDVSVLDLINGERSSEPIPEVEDGAKRALAYSGVEINLRMKRLRRWIFLGASLAILLILFVLWQSGLFHVVDRVHAPEGTGKVTVYSGQLDQWWEGGTALIADKGRGEGRWRVNYGDCEYGGLWWAPDGRKYVLALEYDEGTRLVLTWLDHNSESNLNAYLSMGVEQSELLKNGVLYEDGWPVIEYQFLQWSADSTSMLIFYSFSDDVGARHEGYFWYNCENVSVRAVLEMEQK